MSCKRFVVNGRVQGVWFRASTRDTALALGLSGHALNRADGSVEVVACGDADALDRLETWLHQGPELAKVDAVQVEDLPDQAVSGFRTG
ncbi:MAG: acylphosphatase [Gammaproteobacteria bacterium]|nr:acylphosphatase [Gammaproteobacteria bacterium]